MNNMRTLNDLVRQFPSVFLKIDNKIAINTNAPVKDLFKTYSEIVHYMDNEIVEALENLIKEKLK